MQSSTRRIVCKDKKRLDAIPGVVPSLLDLPAGCKFNTRCPHAFDRCFHDPEPGLLLPQNGHPVRCWLYEEK
jgi:peptide/nickel transport system ATP-binding protein/oligopeptide transport system ATP-binding protein